jgi:PAS domain S-box-containing protein
MPGMPSADQTTSPTSLSRSIKRNFVLATIGVVGLLTIMLWTENAVRTHVERASHSLFPAALASQAASTAFQRMNIEYEDAVVMQEKEDLENARQEGAKLMAALDSAGKSMEFKAGRHKQIVSLIRRVEGLEMRSAVCYAASASGHGVLAEDVRVDLTGLAHENEAVRAALEALQNDLASDFRAELALIGKLLKVQTILETVLLVAVITALFFSTRALIDATARRRGADVLVQAQRETETLLNAVPSLLIGLDANGRIRQWNRAATTILGWQEAAIPGKTLDDCGVEWLTPEMGARIAACVRNSSGERLDNISLARNGTTRLLGLSVLRLETKGAEGILVVGADITEREKVADAFREAERKYRGIFDEAIFGIFQSTPGGHSLSVNPAMARIFGYDSPEEMIATISDISHQLYVDPKHRDEFVLVLDRLGVIQKFECEVFRKDGSKIWIASSARAIRENGVVVRYEGMSEDITESKLLRGQLLQAQKLESVGQLAAGIAHEINTPTQYIGDNVRFLKDAFRDLKSLLASYEQLLAAAKANALSGKTIQEVAAAVEHTDAGYLLEEIPKAIEQTLEGVTRVSTLVSAMKEFSHPGTKEKTPLDLNHAIASTITVARNEWKYVADLETEFDPSLPLISCQPGEFNQVILNLIINAAHAIADVVGKGGSEKGKIKVHTQNCEEWVEIRIQDTGSGIPEKARSRIFDPFFTTKEIGKGTGQGLAIARSVVVDKHGGSIEFETEEGKGTTFIIRLPRDGEAIAAKAVSA